MRLDIYHHFEPSGVEVLQQVRLLFSQTEARLMASLQALEAQVAATKGVMESAVTLIQGLRQQIIDAGTDQAKLDAIVADLDAADDALANAVAANP